MKAVVLSGGKGIHLPTSGEFITKALILVNGMPLIYFVLKHLFFYGITDVVLCVDAQSEKPVNDFLSAGDHVPELRPLFSRLMPKVIRAAGNGKTGSMLYGIRDLLKDDSFIVTYNDIITDINISRALRFHRGKGKILTVAGVHPTIRHGVIRHEDHLIVSYDSEEPIQSTIKGGYFVLRPEVFSYLSSDCVLEEEPFQALISERQAVVYEHHGFWKQFDSYKNVEEMEKLFKYDNPPWMIR